MTIDPNKEYGLLDIVKLDVMGKSHYAVSMAIWKDKRGDNSLGAKIVGSGHGNRYKIKGSNLLNYLKLKV